MPSSTWRWRQPGRVPAELQQQRPEGVVVPEGSVQRAHRPDQVVGESYVRSGFVRALAVTSPKRSDQYPDVEAIAETYPDYSIISYSCFAVRKETPAEIKLRLNRLIMEALYEPSVLARVKELGFTPPPKDWTIEQCDAFVVRERDVWTRAIKLAKIEPQ